jgi:hypothetical protein
MGGHSGTKKTSVKHKIARLCCSICRRPSYMKGNGSKSGRANVFATFAIVVATAPQFGSFITPVVSRTCLDFEPLCSHWGRVANGRRDICCLHTSGATVYGRVFRVDRPGSSGFRPEPASGAPHSSWQNICCDTPAWKNR